MAERFRPAQRIRRRQEFKRAYDRGARIHGRFLTLFLLPNSLDVTRLGIVATRKLGGAVRRNRAKRLIREVFRRQPLRAGLDVVAIARPEMLDAPISSLEEDFRSVIRRYAARARR